MHPTSKMSHDRGRRAACGMTIWTLGFHFEIREIARGVTAMVVGSGALFGDLPGNVAEHSAAGLALRLRFAFDGGLFFLGVRALLTPSLPLTSGDEAGRSLR